MKKLVYIVLIAACSGMAMAREVRTTLNTNKRKFIYEIKISKHDGMTIQTMLPKLYNTKIDTKDFRLPPSRQNAVNTAVVSDNGGPLIHTGE